jgi:hypothetical protein
MPRRRQLTPLTLTLQVLFAVTARAEPAGLTIGLVGISNTPPLELGCVPKDQPAMPSVCELAQLRVDHRRFELATNLACRHGSAVYATSPQLVDFLQKQTTVTLHASGIDTGQPVTLECQIKHTRRTQTEGIQPHS